MFSSHAIEHEGRRIGFEEGGQGEALVMTHSFLCSRRMWEAQAVELARDYRVINVDVRGHGESELGGGTFTIDDLAADVLAVLDAVGIERAAWVGLSIGGMLSLRAALRAPEQVAGLVLADSGGDRDPWVKRTRYRLMATGARWLGIGPFLPAVTKLMFGATAILEQPALVDSWTAEFRSVPMATILAGVDTLCRRRSVLHRLGEVSAPALVLVGAEDLAQPPERSRMLADALPNAVLEVIPAAGHLSAVEQPLAVTEAIRRFLASLGEG